MEPIFSNWVAEGETVSPYRKYSAYRICSTDRKNGFWHAAWTWVCIMGMGTQHSQHNTTNSDNFVITENGYNIVRKYIEYVKKIHHKQRVQCGQNMKVTYGVSNVDDSTKY